MIARYDINCPDCGNEEMYYVNPFLVCDKCHPHFLLQQECDVYPYMCVICQKVVSQNSKDIYWCCSCECFVCLSCVSRFLNDSDKIDKCFCEKCEKESPLSPVMATDKTCKTSICSTCMSLKLDYNKHVNKEHANKHYNNNKSLCICQDYIKKK